MNMRPRNTDAACAEEEGSAMGDFLEETGS